MKTVLRDFKDTAYHCGWLVLLFLLALPGGWDAYDILIFGAALVLTIPMVMWDWRARQERLVIQEYWDEAQQYKWDDCAEGCCS